MMKSMFVLAALAFASFNAEECTTEQKSNNYTEIFTAVDEKCLKPNDYDTSKYCKDDMCHKIFHNVEHKVPVCKVDGTDLLMSLNKTMGEFRDFYSTECESHNHGDESDHDHSDDHSDHDHSGDHSDHDHSEEDKEEQNEEDAQNEDEVKGEEAKEENAAHTVAASGLFLTLAVALFC